MLNSKTMMLNRLATQISRVGSITRLVETSVARNQEPQQWFNCLAYMLHELSNYLSQLRTAVHVTEWPHPTGKNISQDDWVQQLNRAVSEIKDVLDEFAYLGPQSRNIRIVRPCGRSVDIVGRNEPILKLNVLLEKLDVIEKLSEEKIFGFDVREEAQIEISTDQAKILPITDVRIDEHVKLPSFRAVMSPTVGVSEEEQRPIMAYRCPNIVFRDDRDELPMEISSNQWRAPVYSKLIGFLQDPRVLQKVYRKWTELNLKEHVLMVDDGTCSPKPVTGSGIRSNREYLKKAAEVVLCWDPFDLDNSIPVREYVDALNHVMFCSDYSPKHLQCQAVNILTAATSRLEGMISCLINANAAFHNVEKIFESSQQQSHWFCSNTSVTSSYVPFREYDDVSDSYYCSSSTSYAHASEASGTVIGSQIRPSNEIEEEPDGLILHRFLLTISQITSLVGYSRCYNQHFEVKGTIQTVFAQFLNNTMQSFGFQEACDFWVQPKVDFVKMKLSELRERRKNWERAFKVIVLVVLPWQKCLCEAIFSDTPEYTYICFHQVAEICVRKLLNFASEAAYAMPGKIGRVFHLLYVYEVVDSLSENISMVFSDAKKSYIPKEMTNTFSVLKYQISVALNDLIINQLQDDTYCHNSSFGKIESTSKDVDVHPVTKHVMLYLKDLSIYRKILDSSILIMDITTFGQKALTLVTYLKSNLEKKSSLLKTSTAQHIFWINNLNHIVQEANGPSLRNLLAEEWVQEQNDKINWHLIKYTELISAEALSCLNVSNGGNWITVPAQSSIKHAIKSFKLAIEEICKIQASWKVPDPILRAKLRDTMSERVVLAYTTFLETHKHILESKVIMKSSVYTTEDLKFSLQDIFEGSDY